MGTIPIEPTSLTGGSLLRGTTTAAGPLVSEPAETLREDNQATGQTRESNQTTPSSSSSTHPRLTHRVKPSRARHERQRLLLRPRMAHGVRTTPHKAATQSCKSSSKGHAQPAGLRRPPCNFVEAGNRPDDFTAARSGQAIEKVLTMRPSFSSSSLASCGRSSFDSSASSSFDQPSTDSAFHHSRNSLFKPVRALAANDERRDACACCLAPKPSPRHDARQAPSLRLRV